MNDPEMKDMFETLDATFLAVAERLLANEVDKRLAKAQKSEPAIAAGITVRRIEAEGTSVTAIHVQGHSVPFITDTEGYATFVAGLTSALELLKLGQHKENH